MMADMVMRNGRIYTMDEGFTVAEAIAIKDGEILWTGDGADAGRFISKDTKVVDLGGKTVLPGLIDMHVHVPGNAYNALHNIDVYDAKTAEETEEIIRDFIKTHPEKDSRQPCSPVMRRSKGRERNGSTLSAPISR